MLKNTLKILETNKRWQDNPLTGYLRPFAVSLTEKGHPDSTIKSKLWLLGNVGEWLERNKLAVTSLDEPLINRFRAEGLSEGRLHRGNEATLKQFLNHLRICGVVSNPNPVQEQSLLEKILSRYETYLRSERGLVTATIINYKPVIREFLLERFRDEPLLLTELKPPDISGFILRHFQKMSLKRAQLMTTALRSFFRFLFRSGELQIDLAASVPTVAGWSQSTVPKYLIPEQVERVLRTFDLQTPTGRRDYAILLLLARLGLRAGEVVALKLDDLDWRAGEPIIRGKGLFHDKMPLPSDVGDAVAAYLRRDRPQCQTRQLFVCMRAPRRGFAGPSTVTTIVRRALDRADLHPTLKGAHLLRHSLATSMLRSGVKINEIGDVLRHRAPNTTEIYAKVDFDALRSLAHPWPIGGER
jgi:site-specific recombinase XerD